MKKKLFSNKQQEVPYHRLSYRITDNSTGVGFDFKLVFDEFKSDYIFDIEALKASTIKNGIYPIIVCSCDYIGCGGAYVLTHIEGEDIIWEKFWDGMSCGEPDNECEYPEFDLIFPYDEKKEHLVIVPPIRFRFSEYRKLVDELEKESIKLYKNGKQFQETLETYLSGDTFRP